MIKLSKIHHRDQDRLRVDFYYDKEIIAKLKTIDGATWSKTLNAWLVPYLPEMYQTLKNLFPNQLDNPKKNICLIEEEPESEACIPRLNSYDIPNYRKCPQEMKLKLIEMRYSKTTIRNYCGMFEEFINYHQSLDINTIDETQIIKYLRYLVIERKISTSYQNQAINAIKFYYEKVLGEKRKIYSIEKLRKEKALPTVLSTEEIVKLFKSIDNLKHKCMLMLAYSSGLRLGEVVRLKLIDIDRERMQIRIVQGKGKKERYTKLSEKYLKIFDEYLENYNPKEFAFEGATDAEYSPTSIQNIIKEAVRRAGIQKHTTIHTLRHTYATHSLENGIDIRYIQEMLGHYNAHTTPNYTNITIKAMKNIKSPLDSLSF